MMSDDCLLVPTLIVFDTINSLSCFRGRNRFRDRRGCLERRRLHGRRRCSFQLDHPGPPGLCPL